MLLKLQKQSIKPAINLYLNTLANNSNALILYFQDKGIIKIEKIKILFVND